MRRAASIGCIALAFALGCGGAEKHEPLPGVPARPQGPSPSGPVEYEAKWRMGLTLGPYLAPKQGLVGDDGGFDAVMLFHGGAMADKEIRATGLNAVFTALTLGMGSIYYNDAFQNPERFGHMLRELERAMSEHSQKKAHVRRVAIVAWSAGFGAPQKILGQKYDDVIDTVFLLDGLHAGYMDPPSAHRADPRFITVFTKFAKQAVDGRKLMVVTHSSVQTIDYANTRETTAALLDVVGVPPQKHDADWNGLHMILEAHQGNLHVRGFSGNEKKDHVDQLHIVGDLMREYLVPRWSQR